MVAPNGGRWWRLKYRFGGKEKLLSRGTYPDVSLKDARAKRDALRKQIAAGTDPSDLRREHKATGERTFEVIGRQYIAARSKKWSPRTFELVTSRLEKGLFPKIGKRPIHLIQARELLRALEPSRRVAHWKLRVVFGRTLA